jgi:hypothetical protein
MDKQKQQKKLTECEYRTCQQPVEHIVHLKSGSIVFYCAEHSQQVSKLKIVGHRESWGRNQPQQSI